MTSTINISSPREKLELFSDKPAAQTIECENGEVYLKELERIRGVGWRVLQVEVVGAANYKIVAYPE